MYSFNVFIIQYKNISWSLFIFPNIIRNYIYIYWIYNIEWWNEMNK